MRYASALPLEEQAELLERFGYESYVTSRFDAALEAQQRACGLRRRLGAPLGEGESLRRLSRLLRFTGRTAEAMEAGDAAVVLLEPLGAGPELAMAYANLAHIAVTGDDVDGTILWGTRALELARELGDTEALVYALTNIGGAEFLAGRNEGFARLEQSLELARSAGSRSRRGGLSGISSGGRCGKGPIHSPTGTSSPVSNTAPSMGSISGACS